VSLEDICRPGPVWLSPPWAGSSPRKPDGFDHGSEEELSDERASLLAEDAEVGGGALEIGREEEEFQDRSCSAKSVMSEVCTAEPVLQSNGNPLPSPSVQEPTTGALAGGYDMHMNEWKCDFPSCSRVFHKRHDRNCHRKYHFKPFKCPEPLCKAKNVAFSLAKDLKRHRLSHEGKRYFCPRPGCACAASGKFTGFVRIDNWRRHLEKLHP